MIMTSDFQHAFNRVKGVNSMLNNQTLTDFDQCAQNSAQQLQQTIKQQELVPNHGRRHGEFSYVRPGHRRCIGRLFQ